MAIEDRKREVAHDEGPAIIRDHPFEPKAEWWSLCKECNLAESAHSDTVLHHPIGYVGDDDPDD